MKRALDEISRQAMIFGDVGSVVALLDDVDAWEDPHAVVNDSVCSYLHASVGCW